MAPEQISNPLHTPAEYHRGATRLLEVIEASVDPSRPFPYQLDAALEATLGFFAADPELADLLCTAWPANHDLAATQLRWATAFAGLLREAASSWPEAHTNPPFVESHLIASVAAQIRHCLHRTGAAGLQHLLPDQLGFLLAYYRDLTP